eukprot:maker-scaffold67_size430214-snap-gene-1.16 protein:Tk00769 transcript:maker-scaffold67_size430214-snap-gene-1.16-mRNA-1 annotation:"AGAP005417-PA"
MCQSTHDGANFYHDDVLVHWLSSVLILSDQMKAAPLIGQESLSRGPNYPKTLQVMATIHGICIVFLALSVSSIGGNFASRVESNAEACLDLPESLKETCVCSELMGQGGGLDLTCKRLNSTSSFDFDQIARAGSEVEESNDINAIYTGSSSDTKERLRTNVREIQIQDSYLESIQLSDFIHFHNLRKLRITNSGAREVVIGAMEAGGPTFSQLETLSLSGNRLSSIHLHFHKFPKLTRLNLSGNAIRDLEANLHELTTLEALDLSSNNLDENINPDILRRLPESLTSLDISANQWNCSPKLSWIYSWSQPYLQRSILQNIPTTQCRYIDSPYDGRLILVMEYYSKYVIPSCPTQDNCACALTSVQEKMVHARERVYTVEVSCVKGGLSHFPKLPKNTRTVDLSGNKLNGRSFTYLKVSEHNYKEVDNLTLDSNRLKTLPEKLLDMKLGLSFSAKHNNLTSIPYDFSQRLMKTTAVIKLSNNPWKCTCTSQITDYNLLAKIRDRSEMTCGPSSDEHLKAKQIDLLSPEMLCPPETKGEFRELFLQILCVILTILIILVLLRLAYDYWKYRTKGQLPWLVLKMP